ncbi:hypothetical protein GALL_289630 [mine drainage metagenome]|uniref:Uncharacterized protein n=1 Tax=mine drainage metagenome TaxID=410659 RepID=A0A1J5QZI9_9ZZZZ
MRRLVFLACLAAGGLAAGRAVAAPASFMFTPSEAAAIDAALSGAPPPGPPPVAGGRQEMGTLSLQAVMNAGPDRWTLWVNGRRLSPHTELQGVRVLALDGDRVEFEIAAAPPRRVWLRPNQTYIVATGRIEDHRP